MFKTQTKPDRSKISLALGSKCMSIAISFVVIATGLGPAFALTPQTSSFAMSNVAVCSPVPTSNVLIQFAVSSSVLPSGNIVFHIAEKVTVTDQAGHVIGTGHGLVDTVVHQGSWNTNQDVSVGTCSGSGLQYSVHLVYTIDSSGSLIIRS